MFGKLFRRQAPVAAPRATATRTGEGRRIYCIGDIHGRSDLLTNVARWIAEDAKSATSEPLTVFLGDYIDRGPDSKGVLERLSARDFPTPVLALMGNHEQMLLGVLDNEAGLADWRQYGGLETLHSYGVRVGDVMRGEKFAEARAALIERLPLRHREFLAGCQLSASSGDYYFCHAGVRPDLPLAMQGASDLLWIREPFIRFEGSFGKRIVHGHTPVEQPDVRPNRINIDTGAYATGILTCLVLEDESIRFFSTG